MTFAGHCLCGLVTYEVDAAPKWVAHCHCAKCRRHTGSVVATFAGTDLANVRWGADVPARFESSPGTWRGFCPRCGTPLCYESQAFPGEIHFYLGTLDHPEAMPATAHVHTAEQLAWFEVFDDCPRFATLGVSAEPLRHGPQVR